MITGAHHLDADILRKFICIEFDDFGCHDLADGRCKICIAGGVHRAVSGNDHGAAIFLRCLHDFFRDVFGTHQDQKSGSHLNDMLLCLGIVSRNDDLVLDIMDGNIFFGDGNN